MLFAVAATREAIATHRREEEQALALINRRTQYKLRNNDPSLEKLTIGHKSPLPPTPHERDQEFYYPAEDCEEWRKVGESIGRHEHLEELEIKDPFLGAAISREQLEALLMGMARNRSVRTLSFRCTNLGGWAFDALAPFLNNNGNLKSLSLSNCDISAPFPILAHTFASARGSLLEKITIYGNKENTPFSTDGMADVEQLLCDTTSINATYLSNHSLNEISLVNVLNEGPELVKLTDALKANLKLNKDGDKDYVARQKVLQNHFGGDFSIVPFGEESMDIRLLPHVLSWLGRPRLDDLAREKKKQDYIVSQSALFEFLLKMPTLFE